LLRHVILSTIIEDKSWEIKAEGQGVNRTEDFYAFIPCFLFTYFKL